MIVNFRETRWTFAGRFFCHRYGIGFYSYSPKHDHIFGFVLNGIGRWVFVNQGERYDAL